MTEEPEITSADTPDEAEPADQPASAPEPAPAGDDEGGEGNQGEGPAEGDE